MTYIISFVLEFWGLPPPAQPSLLVISLVLLVTSLEMLSVRSCKDNAISNFADHFLLVFQAHDLLFLFVVHPIFCWITHQLLLAKCPNLLLVEIPRQRDLDGQLYPVCWSKWSNFCWFTHHFWMVTSGCFQHMEVHPNHPTLGHVSIETHGDMRNPQFFFWHLERPCLLQGQTGRCTELIRLQTNHRYYPLVI